MVKITIDIPDDIFKSLESRAKKNLFEIESLVLDIVRRSMLSYKSNGNTSTITPDDRLVNIFSRQTKGRPRKKKS